jgi:hypothetical protein
LRHVRAAVHLNSCDTHSALLRTNSNEARFYSES